MITPGINFIKFNKKSNAKQIKKKLQIIIKDKNQIINSLSSNYKNNFDIKKLSKIKKFKNFRIIGMGGSILGTQAIYDFLKHKIKKNFTFIYNLQPKIKSRKKKKIC